MKIAWITDKTLFQDVIGGAEQADQDMIRRRPEDVEVRVFRPGRIGEWLGDFDKVVVTSHVGLLNWEIDYLASLNPVFWAHVFCGEENYRHGRKLFEAARPFIALTPEHLEKESEWLALDNPDVNPGYIDLLGWEPQPERAEIAVWPHRDVPHKGWDYAQNWAMMKGVPILKMSDYPRQAVLQMMASVRYFVLLSYIFDAGPRAALEARMLDCEMIVKDVGWFKDTPPSELRRIVEDAPKKFWEMVCL